MKVREAICGEGARVCSESIQESSGVVKVREAMLAEGSARIWREERGGGRVECLRCGHDLGVRQCVTYWSAHDLGARARPRRRGGGRRALPIYERASTVRTTRRVDHRRGHHAGESRERVRRLGDYAKARDVLERALAIKERAYAAATSTQVGHHADEPRARVRQIRRPREEARRAGARARDQGAGVRPRPRERGQTLGNLGNAYGALGDHAKKRDMLERALCVKIAGDQAKAREYFGRDHPEVATARWTLTTSRGRVRTCLATTQSPPRRVYSMGARGGAIETASRQARGHVTAGGGGASPGLSTANLGRCS